MPVTIRFGLFRHNTLSRHRWKVVVAVVALLFFAYAMRHLFFPNVQAWQEKVAGEMNGMKAGQTKWRFGYCADNRGGVYECEDAGFPFGHIIRLYPDGRIKSIFPTFLGAFIGRGYLCDDHGRVVGVYRSLWPKCVESDYLESMPPPPRQWRE